MISRHMNIGIYFTVFVALADQLSKWWLLGKMAGEPHVIPVTSFFNLVLVWNKGVTFGLLNHFGHHAVPYILIGVALVILVLLGRWMARTSSTVIVLALGAIMGGAIGNVIDRIRHGAVVDFLDFYYRDYHWYAFNVADAMIVTGVALLLLDGMVRGR